jgi:DNA polymerase eta
MDAYYAQVEMKKHNVPENEPLGVLQWRSLIAINYAAKDQGVKRGMTVYEALAVCPDCKFAHVSTLIDKDGKDHVIESSLMKV